MCVCMYEHVGAMPKMLLACALISVLSCSRFFCLCLSFYWRHLSFTAAAAVVVAVDECWGLGVDKRQRFFQCVCECKCLLAVLDVNVYVHMFVCAQLFLITAISCFNNQTVKSLTKAKIQQ